MNQEPNNNLENTQTGIDATQAQPVIDNTQPVQMPPVSEATEELDLPTTTTEAPVQPTQPAIAPTVTVSTPIEEEKIEIVDGQSNAEIGTKPHDVPIPDENSDKKDFVIKSKKETVAEDVKQRQAKIEERVKKANENYKPNSKFTNVFVFIFLTFMIAFTFFLPEIREFVMKAQSGELEKKEEVKITDGRLLCTYNKSSEYLDYEYEYSFVFSKNRLETYDKSVTVKGDASLDKDTLDKMKSNCNEMKTESNKIAGITVSCSSDTNKSKTTEKIEPKDFETGSITPAYTEAGGEYPEYSFEQDIDDIEKNMKAAGFTCERVGS